eukprot:CAMPEP_0206272448 /NCGR_PEP_ID=MMETSP0047_2-20121206/34013_1 /ASSEMBLY_ACC=CAM_ASM_000192 /TAXON_ID=195065 /ORGANISM="Chroomonas mesostigmatica_cf, Strain CCMP1168" /LENGTH=38 /DNA_ID= /DNA_START= /DNA_END= /DNA_ORIENTATION=
MARTRSCTVEAVAMSTHTPPGAAAAPSGPEALVPSGAA